MDQAQRASHASLGVPGKAAKNAVSVHLCSVSRHLCSTSATIDFWQTPVPEFLTLELADLQEKYPEDLFAPVVIGDSLQVRCYDCPEQLYVVDPPVRSLPNVVQHLTSSKHISNVLIRLSAQKKCAADKLRVIRRNETPSKEHLALALSDNTQNNGAMVPSRPDSTLPVDAIIVDNSSSNNLSPLPVSNPDSDSIQTVPSASLTLDLHQNTAASSRSRRMRPEVPTYNLKELTGTASHIPRKFLKNPDDARLRPPRSTTPASISYSSNLEPQVHRPPHRKDEFKGISPNNTTGVPGTAVASGEIAKRRPRNLNLIAIDAEYEAEQVNVRKIRSALPHLPSQGAKIALDVCGGNLDAALAVLRGEGKRKGERAVKTMQSASQKRKIPSSVSDSESPSPKATSKRPPPQSQLANSATNTQSSRPLADEFGRPRAAGPFSLDATLQGLNKPPTANNVSLTGDSTSFRSLANERARKRLCTGLNSHTSDATVPGQVKPPTAKGSRSSNDKDAYSIQLFQHSSTLEAHATTLKEQGAQVQHTTEMLGDILDTTSSQSTTIERLRTDTTEWIKDLEKENKKQRNMIQKLQLDLRHQEKSQAEAIKGLEARMDKMEQDHKAQLVLVMEAVKSGDKGKMGKNITPAEKGTTPAKKDNTPAEQGIRPARYQLFKTTIKQLMNTPLFAGNAVEIDNVVMAVNKSISGSSWGAYERAEAAAALNMMDEENDLMFVTHSFTTV